MKIMKIAKIMIMKANEREISIMKEMKKMKANESVMWKWKWQ